MDAHIFFTDGDYQEIKDIDAESTRSQDGFLYLFHTDGTYSAWNASLVHHVLFALADELTLTILGGEESEL